MILEKSPVKKTRDHSPFERDFSPVLAPGDSLLVSFEYDASGMPSEIDMTIPNKPVPYTFVPILTTDERKKRLFPVMFHDGVKREGECLNGALRCELRALTPLMVGHFSYSIREHPDFEIKEGIIRGKKEKYGQLLRGKNWELTASDPDGNIVQVNTFSADKKVLEPLFSKNSESLDQEQRVKCSRVILPGSSIKGMLRQNIGAMLGAPMERVQEQYFSYRPNLGWNDNQPRYQCREAIVVDFHYEKDRKILKVRLLEKGRHAYFLDGDTFKRFTDAGFKIGDKISNNKLASMRLKKRNGSKQKQYRIKFQGDRLPEGDYRICNYKPGTDGNGLMAKYGLTKEIKDDRAVLVSETAIIKATEIPVPPEILDQYSETWDQFLHENGYKGRNPSVFADKDERLEELIQENIVLNANQLIYVEIQSGSMPEEVVSFGSNFRYRWRYADTIRTAQIGSSGKNRERTEVKPLDGEGVDSDGGMLSGARLLFGYTSADPHDQRSEQAGSAGIGEKNWSRFAGRVAVNHAVEVSDDLSCLTRRFVTRSGQAGQNLHDFTIPFKVLASPKASAVEHYLQQPDHSGSGHSLQTYGDLPGVEASGAELNGRKFYRHQPVHEVSNSPFKDSKLESVKGNQSTLARFISRSNTRFRFTLRFKDLALWELGALLVALDPEQLNETPAASNETPRYANKLGHGRPLGLGSVRIHVDEILKLDDEALLTKDHELHCSAIKAFKEQMACRNLSMENWLKVLDYSKSRAAEYPNADNKIYTYHTNIRALYSIKRRQQGPDGGQKPRPMPENFGDLVRPDYGEED